jgi:hypothetical protein
VCLGMLIDRWEYALGILWLESYLDSSATVREGKLCDDERVRGYTAGFSEAPSGLL